MSDNVLLDLSFAFAVEIVRLVDTVSAPKSSYMFNQLARAGTSIGANIHEAQYAQSRADFVSKMEIALKEASETGYWLRLLCETGRMDKTKYYQLNNDCGRIQRMLIASCRTAKGKEIQDTD